MRELEIKTAWVVSNPKKKESPRIKKDVERFLKKRGVKLSEDADVLITVGGDGTILFTKELWSMPVFGIGSERSFLCHAHFNNWKQKLSKALKNNSLEKRLMLSAFLNGEKLEDALNEVVVHTRDYRVLGFKVTAEKQCVSFRADGVIFSTPTGSTGYAYSAGGDALPPRSSAYEIIPIAPYRRSFEGMLLDEHVESKVEVADARRADVIIDGQFVHGMRRKSTLRVRKSKRSMEFLVCRGEKLKC